MATRSLRNFSRNVQAFMDLTGISRSQLAEICGLPLPRITDLLAARYGKNLDTIDSICNSLNSFCADKLGVSEPAFTPELLIAEDFHIPLDVLIAANRKNQKKVSAVS